MGEFEQLRSSVISSFVLSVGVYGLPFKNQHFHSFIYFLIHNFIMYSRSALGLLCNSGLLGINDPPFCLLSAGITCFFHQLHQYSSL